MIMDWQEGYKHELQPPAAHLGRQQAHPGLGVPPGLGQSRKVGAPQGLGAPPGLRTPQSMGMQPQLGTAAGADKPTRAFPGSDHQSGDWWVTFSLLASTCSFSVRVVRVSHRVVCVCVETHGMRTAAQLHAHA